MLDEIKKQLTSFQILTTLLILAVGIYLFQIIWQVLGVFSDIFVILISAWVLSFLLEPLVEEAQALLKIHKVVATSIVYVVFFSLLAITITLFIPAVGVQITGLEKALPKYLSTSPQFVNKLTNDTFSFLGNSLTLLPGVAQFLFYLFLVVIISFYFVLDKESIQKEFLSIMPKKWHEHILYVQELIDSTFGSFLRVQLLFGLIGGFATWIVLRIFGIDFAASTALISGILMIIPLVGGLLALIPPVAIAFASDPIKALIIGIILVIMQNILFNIVGPKILGKALKLHPVVVLLSFLVGYKIAGGFGAIFAVPVLGVLFVIVHNLSRHYFGSKQ